jgi:hypothetical protein
MKKYPRFLFKKFFSSGRDASHPEIWFCVKQLIIPAAPQETRGGSQNCCVAAWYQLVDLTTELPHSLTELPHPC